jgi:hypothetical protein
MSAKVLFTIKRCFSHYLLGLETLAIVTGIMPVLTSITFLQKKIDGCERDVPVEMRH